MDGKKKSKIINIAECNKLKEVVKSHDYAHSEGTRHLEWKGLLNFSLIYSLFGNHGNMSGMEYFIKITDDVKGDREKLIHAFSKGIGRKWR